MGPLSPLVSLTLARDLARALRDGHPWASRDALDRPPRLASGTAAELRSREGKVLGIGFWDARSSIAVRVLQAGPLADPDVEVDRRLKAALAFRLERLDRGRTNAFRWVHGEADRLPGIHVDLYDDVAVVRYDGEGAPAFYRDLGARLAEAARPIELRAVLDRQSGDRLHGRGAPKKFEVRENALR